MTLIEGIGDEVIQFFVALVVLSIACFAWWTTSISEHRHVQTVWLLDRRRHRAHRRLTNHTHSVTISEGTQAAPSETGPVGLEETSPKPPEAGTSAQSTDEREDIVERMDEGCELRQRRLGFLDGNTGPSAPIMEHNFAESSSLVPKSDITIKLKYINDDLKLVDGRLTEQLGDFKKRHFPGELSANKLVRLIFNGQVLQPDTKTLSNCGLFDNCVVHCLIHQRLPLAAGEDQVPNQRGEEPTIRNQANQGRDWDLGNFLFAIISFTLLSAWYFRYVYAHLYTVTATVGLVLMTAVFTIVLFGFYFPDHDQQRPENRVRREI